jgi:hypothetical protein
MSGVNVAEIIQAVRSGLSAPANYDTGDAFRDANPTIGPVSVEKAWRLRTANLEDAPAEAYYAIITSAARDRVLRLKASERMARQRLTTTEIIAYMKRPVNELVDGSLYYFDSAFSDLTQPQTVQGEILLAQRPYLLIVSSNVDDLREVAYLLFGGIVCVVVLAPSAWMWGRWFWQMRNYKRRAKALYAKMRIHLELSRSTHGAPELGGRCSLTRQRASVPEYRSAVSIFRIDTTDLTMPHVR